MSLDRTVKWIDKTEGRDKFCKAIQYACRFLKHRFEVQGNTDAAKKFQSLFTNMRDARKLFRLFKTVNELKKIKDLLENDLTTDNVLNILIRGLFGLYWLFDNLGILSKIKILNFDPKKMGKIGSTFWLLALLTNIALVLRELSSNIKKSRQLKKTYYSSTSDNESKERKRQFSNILDKRNKIYLTLIKLLGDVIPAGQGAEFFQSAFGVAASDSLCGVGGFVAAILTSYQLYD